MVERRTSNYELVTSQYVLDEASAGDPVLAAERFRSFARRKKWWMMTPKSANRDTTIEDIHRTRMRLAEKFGDDIAAILEDARKRQEASGRAIWRGPRPNNALQPTGAAIPVFQDSKSPEAAPAAEL